MKHFEVADSAIAFFSNFKTKSWYVNCDLLAETVNSWHISLQIILKQILLKNYCSMRLERCPWNLVAWYLAWSWQPFVFTECKFCNIDFDVCKLKCTKQFLVYSKNESNGYFRPIIIQSVYFCCNEIRRNSSPSNSR